MGGLFAAVRTPLETGDLAGLERFAKEAGKEKACPVPA
jgi:hypothetical protein